MANTTERLGVHHCGMVAENNNWMFREQPTNDIGIDAHIEFVDSSGKAQLLGLQIKSGSSWFNEKKDNYIVFRGINERQYKYWTMNSLPCVIVLYNPEDGLCIWERLSSDTIERTKGGNGEGFKVKVPLRNCFLDKASNDTLLSISNLPIHITNYNFLLSQKQFMKIIQHGGSIKLHSKEWVNKSSGRGDVELIVCDGEKEYKYSYPYWFPFTPYTEVFPKLFPWADFSADEDFFYDNDYNHWLEYCCHYDKETAEWIIVGRSFEDFRSHLSPMRYIDIMGEVAEYMLILTLNDLGKSFMEVDRYLSQNQPYTKAIPEVISEKKGAENR